ncbi:hypothetical protein Taro_049561 [Colocasia esculenta]|uniref:BAR domain-containing protein n=1 Tax=Colocasia esculenta TaxID=4460 RepID=A0A843XBC4_COLES|nr:hypothetical protein [Colocasia esculenta]
MVGRYFWKKKMMPRVAALDFQKDIVRAAESFTSVGCKHIEVGTKFSEDCCRYGGENINNGELAKAASIYGSTLMHLEKEFEEFNRTLSLQIMEPLKQMITGAPLEDARHLAQRYSRMRHEAELQAAEMSRRQLRVREAPIPENTAKLQTSEAKMHELKANMAVLGKEAAAALAAVESQQQRLTLQRLVAMIDAEKSFHLRLAAILDEVEAEIVTEKQKKESAPPSAPNLTVSQSCVDKALYFLAEAMHPFEATSLNELSLAVGDYVVVRQFVFFTLRCGACQPVYQAEIKVCTMQRKNFDVCGTDECAVFNLNFFDSVPLIIKRLGYRVLDPCLHRSESMLHLHRESDARSGSMRPDPAKQADQTRCATIRSGCRPMRCERDCTVLIRSAAGRKPLSPPRFQVFPRKNPRFACQSTSGGFLREFASIWRWIWRHSSLVLQVFWRFYRALKVTPTGWAEGECRGRAGWFPAAYVEKRHGTPTSKVEPEAF